ncbi:hypothetical protein B0H15DRAFT_952745 [Mycena belliarum]|uniref:Uncharacterized protein n=1 Tax=Mycena belliarum TaxID=1033014 RepID=A0AAD6XL19_9AGAR|nr:hypothetical protein B0H15DRAFT_952745 [Mycena belliae]
MSAGGAWIHCQERPCCNKAYENALELNLPRNACPTHHAPSSAGLPQAPLNLDPAPRPPPTAVQPDPPAATQSNPRLTLTAPPARRLAQPLGPLWKDVRAGALEGEASRLDLKVKQLAMDERQKRTVELIIYHRANTLALVLYEYIPTFPSFQLSSLPGNVLEALTLRDTSRADYWNGSWKIIDMQTVLTVEKGRSTRLKLRPSLLQELLLTECPGLADHLARQPRVVGTKRAGQSMDVVSPVKKAAKTCENQSITQVVADTMPTFIDVDAVAPLAAPAIPPSQSILSNTIDLTAAPIDDIPTVVKRVKSTKREEHEWIADCSLSRWVDGWSEIRQRIKHIKKATEASEFPKDFQHPYLSR